jgi:hypothetical protein
MFGLFKTRSEKEKLQKEYRRLLEQAHKLSHTNRRASDEVTARAEEISKKIEALQG